MTKPIATPTGLYKAGDSGAGGMFQPFDLMDEHIFRLNQERIIYGLALAPTVQVPADAEGFKDSIIIDIITPDGKTIQDPHQNYAFQFVTDFPAQNVGMFFGYFRAPQYDAYLTTGEAHPVIIRIAPRQAPPAGTTGATATLPKRDFSEAAGGVTKIFYYQLTGTPGQ